MPIAIAIKRAIIANGFNPPFDLTSVAVFFFTTFGVTLPSS
jgi:hypothetical protein